MTSYLYCGVRTSLNIAGQDVQLCPGSPVELPESSPYIQRLLAVGLLKPAAAPASPAAPGPAVKAAAKSKGGRK